MFFKNRVKVKLMAATSEVNISEYKEKLSETEKKQRIYDAGTVAAATTAATAGSAAAAAVGGAGSIGDLDTATVLAVGGIALFVTGCLAYKSQQVICKSLQVIFYLISYINVQN